MHLCDQMRLIAQAERTATPDMARRARQDARAPIEQWRQSPAGQAVESEMKSALTLPDAARVSALSHLLARWSEWLPSYSDSLWRALAHDQFWQPPLTDFKAEGHVGLHLIEREEIRLSIILLHGGRCAPPAPPAVIRLSSGHRLLCPIAGDEALLFRQWQLAGDSANAVVRREADGCVARGEVFHCALSRQYVSFYPPSAPLILLRLEWPEDRMHSERTYDTDTGAPISKVIGSGRFRQHMALATLINVAPSSAARHLPDAIASERDDALRWHYCRQLLAIEPSAALPILIALAQDEASPLRPLAVQTLAILRTHYSALVEAA